MVSMARASKFSKPTGIRQTTPTQALNQRVINVETFTDLVNAIGLATSRGLSSNGMPIAGTIIEIVKPLTFLRPIIIPAECAGITIQSSGVVPLFADGDVDFAFISYAEDTRLLGLHCEGNEDLTGFVGFAQFDFTGISGGFTVDDCAFTSSQTAASSVFVDTVDNGVRKARISNNTASGTGITGTFCSMSGFGCLVIGNNSEDFDTFFITNDAAAGSNVVVANNVGSGDIDTTVGGGRNTIAANTNSVNILNQVTDRVGLNS